MKLIKFQSGFKNGKTWYYKLMLICIYWVKEDKEEEKTKTEVKTERKRSLSDTEGRKSLYREGRDDSGHDNTEYRLLQRQSRTLSVTRFSIYSLHVTERKYTCFLKSDNLRCL